MVVISSANRKIDYYFLSYVVVSGNADCMRRVNLRETSRESRNDLTPLRGNLQALAGFSVSIRLAMLRRQLWNSAVPLLQWLYICMVFRLYGCLRSF